MKTQHCEDTLYCASGKTNQNTNDIGRHVGVTAVKHLYSEGREAVYTIYHITQVTMCVLVGGGGIDVLLRRVAVNHLIHNGPSPPSVCGAGGGAR